MTECGLRLSMPGCLDLRRCGLPVQRRSLTHPLTGHVKTAQQRTIIQQFSDWYTGRWWVGCYIWYNKERPGRAAAPPSPLLAVPNVTAQPSTAGVPTSYYSLVEGPAARFGFQKNRRKKTFWPGDSILCIVHKLCVSWLLLFLLLCL